MAHAPRLHEIGNGFCETDGMGRTLIEQVSVVDPIVVVIAQVKAATGVFFSGGDQGRIMDLLKDPNFSDVADLFRSRYEEGVPFGGTSAGMAIMSKDMFTGDENPALIDPKQAALSRPGLGLLPGVMVDTHFIIRQRENRMFSYLLGHNVPIGLGVNEDAVVEITDGQVAEVIGNQMVMVADAKEHPGDLLIKLLNPGDTYDLITRKLLGKGVAKPATMCGVERNPAKHFSDGR